MPPTGTSAVHAIFDQRLFVVRAGPRSDPFARLVRQVHDDPDNAYSIERYLWVLEEAPPEPCDGCGRLFLPSFDYEGEPAKGRPRRYCSLRCRGRVYDRRRPPRRRRRAHPDLAA
jgi:hypothetical protein